MSALERLREHHQGAGAPAARRCSRSGCSRSIASASSSRRPGVDRNVMRADRGEAVGRRSSACSTCSRAARSSSCRSSRSASCRTSRRASSCSCWALVVQAARRAAQGRRAGPAQDQPVHALRHDRAVARSRASASRMFLEGLNNGTERRPVRRRRRRPGLGLPPDDDDHADHRHRLHHVARRADHRARHRQRHLADHLRRHRRRTCPTRCSRLLSQVKIGQIQPLDLLSSIGASSLGDRRGDRVLRARAAPDPDPLRQAHGRPEASTAGRARTCRSR